MLKFRGEIIGEIEGDLAGAVTSPDALRAADRYGAGVELLTNGGKVVASTEEERLPGGGRAVAWRLRVDIAPAQAHAA